MDLDWLLALCAWLPLPCVAWFAKRTQGAWLAPGALAALTWTIAAGVPLWLAPDLPAHPSAYLFVLVIVLACVAGSTLGASTHPGRSIELGPMSASWRSSTWRFYFACVLIGCVAPIMLFGDASRHTQAANLSELAMYTSMGRYEGDYDVPLHIRMLSSSIHLAATLSGFLLASTKAEDRQWRSGLLWLVPLVGKVLIDTTKANIFYGLVLWGAGWAAGAALSMETRTRPRGAMLAKVALAGIAVLVFLVVSQSMRMNRLSLADLEYVVQHIRIYFVGHMPVFGHWLVHDFPRTSDVGLGTQTFAGVAELLGISQRQSGVYDGTADFTEANIYTGFRPLLEDFGTVGGLMFMFVLSFAAGVGWRLLRAGRTSGAAPVVVFAAHMLSSPITPLFVYIMLTAVVVLFAAWMVWGEQVRARERRRQI